MESKQQGIGIHQKFPERGSYHQDSWSLGASRENTQLETPGLAFAVYKHLSY